MSKTRIPRNLLRISMLALAYAALLLAGGLGGCAEHQPQSMLIRGNGFISSAITCDPSAAISEEGPFRMRGRMDVKMTRSYGFIPVVHNLMPEVSAVGPIPRGPAQFQQPNATLMIDGVTANYRVSGDLIPLPQGIFIHWAGSIPPGGLYAGALPVVPRQIGDILRESKHLEDPYNSVELLVGMTIEGHLQDGTMVNSNEFIYPIEVCHGCLLQSPLSNQPTFEACNIVALATAPPPTEQQPCFFGQDEPMDCRVCMAATKNDETLCVIE